VSTGGVESKLLNRLKAEQQQFAVDALRRPQERDAFEYGYRVGTVAGYEAAINVLLKLLDEEKYSDNDL
jgi:hypothetical protein